MVLLCWFASTRNTFLLIMQNGIKNYRHSFSDIQSGGQFFQVHQGSGQFSYAYTTGAISLMAPGGNAGHGYQHRPSYGRTVNTRQGPWLQVITWAHHAWELQWPLPEWGGPCGNQEWPTQLPFRPNSRALCWPWVNNYAIYDLLEWIKAPVMQNHRSKISMTLDNRMISDRLSLEKTNTAFLTDINNERYWDEITRHRVILNLYKKIPLSFSTQYFLVFHSLEL